MSSTTTTTANNSQVFTIRGAKTFQPLSSQISPATKSKIQASFGRNWIRDQFSLTSWLSIGATLQLILFLTLKPSYASLPVLAYTIYTIGSLLHASLTKPRSDPNITYHRTASLLPSSIDGTIRAGTSGSKIAVLHLGFKNFSPLGPLAPGFQQMFKFAPEMIAELESPAGRAQYGFLGQDTFFQASSPVSTTNSSTLMVIMYFRSIEGVHAYAQSDLHRKAWKWYDSFSSSSGKGNGVGNKHLGIMHEVFEAEAGKWETVAVNMEKIGVGKASVALEDGSIVGTVVDASRGVLASAKGRVA